MESSDAPIPTMTSCVTSAMMSPVATTNSATSYPTPRTQSTAHMLTALKSHSKHSLRNEISPASGVASLPPRPGGSRHYAFTEEEDHVEEKALIFLQRTGHLAQVAGSQSMLSQELLAEGEELESVPSSQISTISTKTPKSIARRYGILTQEMEEEEENPLAANEKSEIFYQTPPRKTVARKIVTVTQDSKENSSEEMKKDFKDESQLNGTQPFLTMSQLEEVANGSHLFAYSQSGPSVPNEYRKRASSSSLISLCTAAEKKIDEEARQTEQRTKRKINRKLPTTCKPVASGQPPMKKAKALKSMAGSVDSVGDRFDPNEPMAGEIKWVGRATKSVVVSNGNQDAATQAAAIAHRIMQGDDDLSKRLLLGMALSRDSPRQGPTELPEKGPIPEGFVWAHYPPLEGLLKENMEEYYNLSMAKSHTSKQQLFNNNLVDQVRDLAAKNHWTFPTDRRTLRDRVRCYFKTHLQNAKKRLRTLLRNPTKRANAKNLVKLIDIIPDVADSIVPAPTQQAAHVVPTATTGSTPEKVAEADQTGMHVPTSTVPKVNQEVDVMPKQQFQADLREMHTSTTTVTEANQEENVMPRQQSQEWDFII